MTYLIAQEGEKRLFLGKMAVFSAKNAVSACFFTGYSRCRGNFGLSQTEQLYFPPALPA